MLVRPLQQTLNKKNMKNLILAFSVMMAWSFALQTAAGIEPAYDRNKEIRKHVSYPAFAKMDRTQGFVLVKYLVMDNGLIQVLEMNTSHEELGIYVKEKLEKITLSDANATGTHYARFTFRFLEH